MSEKELNQHENYRKAFEQLVPFMNSKKLPSDPDFRLMLKTPVRARKNVLYSDSDSSEEKLAK